MLRASVGRLDSKVRGLESQGVRSDRRAAELAGLAQALTEEQRALLIRLDRLEEQFRAAGVNRSAREVRGETRVEIRESGGAEVAHRLDQMEQELRMASTNFRLVMNLVDEAEQRQQQQFQSLEAQLEDRLKAVPIRPVLESRPLRPAMEETKSKGGSRAEEVLHAQLSMAEDKTARSLKAAQELLLRCDGCSAGMGSGQENMDPRLGGQTSLDQLGVQTLESHEDAIRELQTRLSELAYNLTPRAELAEAKVQDLADAFQKLQGQSLGTMETRIQCLSQAQDECSVAFGELRGKVDSLPTREHVMELGRAREVTLTSRRVEAHESGLAELWSKVELLPTTEHILIACRDSERVQLDSVQNLQSRIDKLEIARSKEAIDVRANLETQEKGRADEFTLTSRKVEAHESRLAELWGKLEVLPTHEHLHSACKDSECAQAREFMMTAKRVETHDIRLTELSSKLGVLPSHEHVSRVCGESQSAIKSLQSRVNELEGTRSKEAGELQKNVASHAGVIAELRSKEMIELRAVAASHAGTIAELRGHIETLCANSAVGSANSLLLQGHAQDIAELQSCVEVLSTKDGADQGGLSSGNELSSILQKVCAQFSNLQEKVEDEVLSSIAQVEQQLPEALRQLERLSCDSAEHAAKVEEHEVRLGLALTRQAAREERLQGYIDRVEQLPGISRLRGLCREELAARLEEANLEGLTRRLDLTMDAVAELGDKFQESQGRRDLTPPEVAQVDLEILQDASAHQVF